MSLPAAATTVTETFDSRADFESGTAIWNQALGMVHPTLLVNNYLGSPSPTAPVSVGDGSDGAFDNTNYAQWSSGGDVSGNIIRLDTSVHPVLQVTHFTLDAGWTIRPIGSGALIIESLSDVTINGVIQCNGDDAVGAMPGAGRCGGFDGGLGGPAGLAGGAGTNADATVTGGGGGAYQAGTYHGGGGGGSWNGTTSPAGTGANSGGAAGLSNSDPQFLTLKGGAGGGGGSGDAVSAGGAGGGGGGLVIIHAVGNIDIGTSGYVTADGGAGGTATGNGGPGGGGGGGGIQLFSANTVILENSTVSGGASQALAGAGGSNLGGAIGASGSIGRSWVATNNSMGGLGSYNPTEEPPMNSGSDVEFSTATQYVVTKAVDTGGNFATIGGMSLTPTSSDFVFQVAGSDDNFNNDNTGWTTDASAVAKKRYLKMKLSITTSNIFNPTMIDTATLIFSPGSPDQFTFQSAGCGRVESGGSPWITLGLLLLAPMLLLTLRLRKLLLSR